MKSLITTFAAILFIRGEAAFAAPIINENQARSENITIHLDHQEPNRYYVSPNFVTVAHDENGVPRFSYAEFSEGIFNTMALVQMTVLPSYTATELEAAKKAILAKNPNAVFSGLPFSDARVEFTSSLRTLMSDHNCSHKAGVIGQEQACSFILNSNGRRVFLKLLRGQAMMTVFTFLYKVKGLARQADGTLKNEDYEMGIAARISGSQLIHHPELFGRHARRP